MPLVLQNTVTGASIVVTDQTTLEQAITAVQIACNEYANNGDIVTLIQAKDYANSLASQIASELVLKIPNTTTVVPASFKLKISEDTTLVLKDKSYIDAGVTDAKAYALSLLTNAENALNQLAIATANQALVNAKLYTDTKIQDTKLYIDDKNWSVSDIVDINDFAKKERDITNLSLQSLQEIISEFIAKDFTVEKFEQYLCDIQADLYPIKLNPTLEIEGGVQKFKSTEKKTVFAFGNHYLMKDDEQSTFTLVIHDCNYNGYALEYKGHGKDNIADNKLTVFALKSNKLTAKIVSINLQNPALYFETPIFKKNLDDTYSEL
jgi:hypothetical protein